MPAAIPAVGAMLGAQVGGAYGIAGIGGTAGVLVGAGLGATAGSMAAKSMTPEKPNAPSTSPTTRKTQGTRVVSGQADARLRRRRAASLMGGSLVSAPTLGSASLLGA